MAGSVPKSSDLAPRLWALAICAALWLGLGVGATEAKERMSSGAFTAYVIQQLEAEIPNLQMTVIGDLAFDAKAPPDHEWRVFLDNDYRSYLVDPEALPQILSDRLGSMRELLARPQVDASPGRVLPVVRDLDYFQSIRAQASTDFPHLMLNEFLVVLYVLDSQRSMRFLTQGDLADLDVPSDRLHGIAVENLERHLTGLELSGGDGLYGITGADSYEASLILLDSVWTEGPLEVRGDFVVFLPTRNFFLVTGSEDPENLARGQDIADDAFAKEGHPLTNRPFVRRDGRWLPFEP